MANKKVIKNLKKLKSFHNGSYGTDIDIAIKALEQTKWIPVSERLPETDDIYLVSVEWEGTLNGKLYRVFDMARYIKSMEEWDTNDVIAWMPLPEPYKAESEDEE